MSGMWNLQISEGLPSGRSDVQSLQGGVKMQDWILRYKETVYCIANGEVTEHIIASGLSMRDALDLQSQGRLFPTREAARAHIGKTGEKWTNRINPHLHG